MVSGTGDGGGGGGGVGEKWEQERIVDTQNRGFHGFFL